MYNSLTILRGWLSLHSLIDYSVIQLKSSLDWLFFMQLFMLLISDWLFIYWVLLLLLEVALFLS